MKRTLNGRTVIVTRAEGQAEELITKLEQAGAEVIHFPTIRFTEPDSWQSCDDAIEKLNTYHWLVFTSVNGVRRFLDRLRDKSEVSVLASKSIAAVGERTEAELSRAGLHVDVVPKNFSAEGLLEFFQQLDLKGTNVLIPQAQHTRATLLQGLKMQGSNVDGVAVYKTEPVEPGLLYRRLNGEKIDLLTFTSPSTFRNFVSVVGTEKMQAWRKSGCAIAAIGEVTAAAIVNQDFNVDVIPSKSTVAALVEAISEYYR
ncbi:uroporphyrinogen-III synthase [bacterium]|nr:uroporphyrinogen-III synthase [bacterium]